VAKLLVAGVRLRRRGPSERGRPVLLVSLTAVRVTQKGQVTIPLSVREALGIRPGSEVRFELDRKGARLVRGVDRARAEVDAMIGAGEGKLSTDEILALTRR
jgi:AbrB family looped-hinge helix DNA binding protein